MLCCICKSPEHKAIDCKLSWYQRPASYRDHQDDPPRDRDAPGAPEEMDVSAGSGDPDPPADATSDAQPDAKPATSASPSTPVAEERLLDLQGLFVPQATPADLPQWPPVVVPTPEENSLIGDLTLSDEDEDGDDDADGVKMMMMLMMMMALLTRMICLILLMMTTMLMMMTLLMMIWELFPLLILFQLRLVILWKLLLRHVPLPLLFKDLNFNVRRLVVGQLSCPICLPYLRGNRQRPPFFLVGRSLWLLHGHLILVIVVPIPPPHESSTLFLSICVVSIPANRV